MAIVVSSHDESTGIITTVNHTGINKVLEVPTVSDLRILNEPGDTERTSQRGVQEKTSISTCSAIDNIRTIYDNILLSGMNASTMIITSTDASHCVKGY